MAQYKRQIASSGSGSTIHIHPLFEKIKGKSSVVDENFTGINSNKKFTKIFAILFPGDMAFSDNVCTWLQLISTSFYFPEQNASTGIQEKVKNLFSNPNINLEHDDYRNKHVFEFFIYLNMIYSILQNNGYVRDDNIFQFFSGTNFDQIKIAFIGQDPPPSEYSSGYAFHLSGAETTSFILDRCCQETNFYMKLNKRRFLSDEDVSTFKNGCDMTSWINSGVLPMNSSLTYQDTSQFEINSAWHYFTDFVITSLARLRDNIVFILVGKQAARKERLIDKKRHLVMPIHHPGLIFRTSEAERERKSYLDWHRKLPFINANFYLHQCGQKDLINWVPVSSSSAFSSYAGGVFDDLIKYSLELGNEPGDFLKYRGNENLLIFKGEDGKLLLRWQDTSEQFANKINGTGKEWMCNIGYSIKP